ncbi:glycoside hydrolase family 27 protein [Sphaerobolus stellatus SS14]|uniref:Alpha-galactosidase n=1 Tax=Sphaerobolus stellatus (strain SS14) TaxID=990650 RepID=A0A0C9VQY1_SPHS4|nr:glycoside hydrolase family 27 protein [Sphaerobolus stellatus SS14]
MEFRTKLTLFSLLLLSANALDNGLALTPQMGWNTWNHFGCGISEDTILSAANAIKQHNLDKLGYNYVLMDDCWHAPARDPSTNAPVADPEKFPNGVKDLSDKIHAMGLKFGIFSSAGTKTCVGRFGSLGFEEIDSKTYAEWGVDYLKYDNCNNEGRAGTPLISYERYNNMSMGLNATGRPILYSMCNWGEDGPWNFAPNIANSWRISGDIYDNFARYDDRCPCASMLDCKLAGFHCAVARIIDFAAPVGQKAGTGHWNDLDRLQIGNGGMTHDEYSRHYYSNDTLSIITNQALIAVNQDPGTGPANRIWKKEVFTGDGDISLWQGSLQNNVFVVAVMNISPHNQTVDILMEDAFLDQGTAYQAQPYEFFDLWQKDSNGNWGKSIGTVQGKFSVTVNAHGVKVWRAIPKPNNSRRAGEL